MAKQKVLIIGGGFAGIKTALELAGDQRIKVTLVSDNPNFRYYPTLYRYATGGSQENSSIPLKELFEDTQVKLVGGKAVLLNRLSKTVKLADESEHEYDILVLGIGMVTNYFGIPGMEEFSYSIKSIEEVQRFKRHLHQQLIDERKLDLNYVIVGAGPTGIELAGALPDYLHEIMKNHRIKGRKPCIDLIEAAPRLLPRLPKDTSRMVRRRLKRVGVKLYTGQRVVGATIDDLTVNGKPIRSHTIIWTAGVTNNSFFKDNGFTLNSNGKVATDMYLQAEENIYVIGDNANTPFSGMAQTALYDGIYAASTIKRRLEGKDPKSYKVSRPITVIPVGERWAVVLWGKTRIYGWLGWVLREMADLVAFSDYQPWWKAGRQWLTGFDEEETCEICIRANS